MTGAGRDGGPTERDRGRVALVTGGARGIGRAVVEALAAGGHRVVATHRTTPVPPELAGVATWRKLDVTDRRAVTDLVAEIEATLGPVEVVVANAAVLADGMSATMTDEQFGEVLHTDLGGAVHVVRAVLGGMVERGFGRVVAITSVGAVLGSAGQANYATAKAALNGWVGGLAVEVAEAGVTVNAVAPGPIRTELLESLDERRLEALRSVVPARRLGEPADVAALVAFLASDAAGFITGTLIPVDGGLTRGGLWGRSVRDQMLRDRKRARSAGAGPDAGLGGGPDGGPDGGPGAGLGGDAGGERG